MEIGLTQYLVIIPDGEPTKATTRIEYREGMGRIVMANRAIESVGAPVIREKPVLVWDSENWADYVDQFLSLPETEKSIVLDMHSPSPVESSSMTMQNMVQSALACSISRPGEIGGKTSRKLIAVANTNCHEYYG